MEAFVSNLVMFQTPDGSPGYNQFETVDEAVRFIEKLRNEQGIEGARMFALEEIKFELKPYYKVELQALTTTTGGGSGGAPSPSAPSPSAPVAVPPASSPAPSPAFSPPSSPSSPAAPPAPPADQPDPGEGTEQPHRRGLFGR
jgi:hypothetical protein